MVNEEIVRNTITKMREAGISESMISSTLSDLGLSAGQVQAYLTGQKVNAETSNESVENKNSPNSFQAIEQKNDQMYRKDELDHNSLATQTSEKVVQRLNEEKANEAGTQQLKDTITHLAMEQHGQQLQDTHQSVMELHDKFDATNMDTMSNRVVQMNTKLENLENEVSDLKALSGALQSLLQKILETNQQLLFETKNKK